ncbi:hypothetical protein C807_01971 [Lachnospiraceae bacterium 28-4]|nr:hypothetical protein C807_01971 [Lachnospiraceae bacterium 28-4]
MSKRIVILNGSPRKAGNTAALAAIVTGNVPVSKEMIWIKFIRQ